MPCFTVMCPNHRRHGRCWDICLWTIAIIVKIRHGDGDSSAFVKLGIKPTTTTTSTTSSRSSSSTRDSLVIPFQNRHFSYLTTKALLLKPNDDRCPTGRDCWRDSSNEIAAHNSKNIEEVEVNEAEISKTAIANFNWKRRSFISQACHGLTASLIAVAEGTLLSPQMRSASATTFSPDATNGSTTAFSIGGTIDDALAVEAVEPKFITIPLRFVPRLSSYVISFALGGDNFTAILDTGSPFLTIPGNCKRKNGWGCYERTSSKSIPSGLSNTYEMFANNEGNVEWRSAPFSFVNMTTGSTIDFSPFTSVDTVKRSRIRSLPSTSSSKSSPVSGNMIFGVLSESLMDGPGGVFFGLVRDTNAYIRPSFLGQTNVKAFCIDLVKDEGKSYNDGDRHQKTLTLSKELILSPTGRHDYIPLVKDLNQRYGDPTVHYTARVESIVVNGSPLVVAGKSGSNGKLNNKPIYTIFDSGVTGMVVSQGLFEERYALARKNKERNLWGDVELSFRTGGGDIMNIKAHKPITTTIVDMPWKGFKAYLVVVGLSFIDGKKMTVEIDEQKLWLE